MNPIMIQIPVPASLVSLTDTLVPALLYPQSEQIPLWSLSPNSCWWSANNPTYSTSCTVHLPSHLIEIQLSLGNKTSLHSLPNKSYALSQVSCCGRLADLLISHCRVLSVARLPFHKAPVLWGYVIVYTTLRLAQNLPSSSPHLFLSLWIKSTYL